MPPVQGVFSVMAPNEPPPHRLGLARYQHHVCGTEKDMIDAFVAFVIR